VAEGWLENSGSVSEDAMMLAYGVSFCRALAVLDVNHAFAAPRENQVPKDLN